jgi:hypothetical protein
MATVPDFPFWTALADAEEFREKNKIVIKVTATINLDLDFI